MSDAEETLRLEIHETKQNAQETWLHVRCSKMMDALGALKAEHATALSRARAEALEEAARAMQGQHNPPCYERPIPTGTTVGECGNCNRAGTIRRLITTPAPATIPVERVREVLKGLRDHYSSYDAVTCIEAAHRLGVPLDAKGEAANTTCTRCGGPRSEHREDGTRYRERDGVGSLCPGFKP